MMMMMMMMMKVIFTPQRHKSGDIRRVGWRLANFTCKIVDKVQKLQPV
jgi:hypothetical protein